MSVEGHNLSAELLCRSSDDTANLAHRDAGGGAVHSIKKRHCTQASAIGSLNIKQSGLATRRTVSERELAAILGTDIVSCPKVVPGGEPSAACQNVAPATTWRHKRLSKSRRYWPQVRGAPAFPAFRYARRMLYMYRVFAGQGPANYRFETRSVRLMGRPTSVRLEARFWVVLEHLAEVQDMPMAKFLSALYEEALEIHGEVGNFASFLRCCCIYFLDPSFDHLRLAQAAAQNRAKLGTINAA